LYRRDRSGLRWLDPAHQHLTMILGPVVIVAALFIVLIGAVLAMQLRPRRPPRRRRRRAHLRAGDR
jgi:hypothetical protein